MKDGSFHALYNLVNSKKRQEVSAVLAGMGEINHSLEELGVIKKPESLRASVTTETFDKLSLIENIRNLSTVSNTLQSELVKLTSKDYEAVNYIEEAKKALRNKEALRNEKDVEEFIKD